MRIQFSKREVALAAIAALGSAFLSTAPTSASAITVAPPSGNYVTGDFHNHTTCSDGTLSMQKLVNKATATWGLDWFVQAGHGGNGNRNCTLTEDASLGTPNFPFTNQGPTTTWANSIGNAALKGLNASSSGNMWRWQSLQSFQYQVLEDQSVRKGVPLFLGMESVVSGHEHTSMSVITGQMPSSIDALTNGAAVNPTLGNANAHAQWSYCFDRGDTDNSRGTTNQWNCALTIGDAGDVDGSLYTAPATTTFDAAAKKITTNNGNPGHLKTVEAVKWMAKYHSQASYYVPAHLERAGPFNTAGSNGFNIEHLRDFNNAGPNVAFGFETQPGHGASSERGEYFQCRNGGFPQATYTASSAACPTNDTANPPTRTLDSVGGTTYGGTGVYGAQIGGVWDALLGEGRRFWFFASSDWHNRGIFGSDDRRSTQDFQPGEYQKTYALVRNGGDKLRPQTIVDGLRSGNAFASSGAIVDRLGFIACTGKTEAEAAALALGAAVANAAVDGTTCANMGEKLTVSGGTNNVVIAIAVRNPSGPGNNRPNFSPYTFSNPSLKQLGVDQPLNKPVLDHVDLIGGNVVSRPKTSADPDYAGQWPSNWLQATNDYTTGANTAAAVLASASVPAAAKNTTASIVSTFSGGNWMSTVGADGSTYLVMTKTISAGASQYVRLRGTNLPANTPWETDASGNPLPDYYTNNTNSAQLKIPCTTVGTNVPPLGGRAAYTRADINGCPSHLPVVNGQKMVAFDVAAWSDLWFYSNPIYIQVNGMVVVAGVN